MPMIEHNKEKNVLGFKRLKKHKNLTAIFDSDWTLDFLNNS